MIRDINRSGRNRSLKKPRTVVRTPGGRIVYHHKHKRYSVARCSRCGAPLNATPTGSRYIMSKIPYSQRRPNRPYGGNLCSKCLRELMISEAIQEGMVLLAS